MIAADRTVVLHRRVRGIVAVTITWNVAEAIIGTVAAITARSPALLGFALDSVIEVLSALMIAWQFTRTDPERFERTALRGIGVAFFLLAGYVAVSSVSALVTGSAAEHSLVGIILTGVSLVVMPALAWLEFRTGRELGSASVIADAKQLLLCIQLSGTVFLGLILTTTLGWWWADPVAALLVAILAVREGLEAWRGDHHHETADPDVHGTP